MNSNKKLRSFTIPSLCKHTNHHCKSYCQELSFCQQEFHSCYSCTYIFWRILFCYSSKTNNIACLTFSHFVKSLKWLPPIVYAAYPLQVPMSQSCLAWGSEHPEQAANWWQALHRDTAIYVLTYGQFRVATWPNMHAIELWKQTCAGTGRTCKIPRECPWLTQSSNMEACGCQKLPGLHLYIFLCKMSHHNGSIYASGPMCVYIQAPAWMIFLPIQSNPCQTR